MSGAVPAPPPESFVIQEFAGLKNTVTAERLGPKEQAVARNIDLDDVGQMHRRRGYTRVATGRFHSLFQSTARIYGVSNDALGIIRPNYTFVPLRTSIGSARLAYVEVAGDVYFSSALSSGVIRADQTVDNWGAVTSAGTWLSPVVNPTTTLSPVGGRLLGRPPLATALAYLNGRIYLADGATVWATELFLYDYVDKTKTFLQFESDVTLVGSVSDGLYVGTTTGVWFLSGPFNEMKRVNIMSSAALPGSLVYLPAELVDTQMLKLPQTNSKNAVLFLTTAGLCVGFDSGVTFNISQNNVVFPDATSAAAMWRRQDGVNQYIGVTDSGGSPTSSARMGDYMDAEIRRFNP